MTKLFEEKTPVADASAVFEVLFGTPPIKAEPEYAGKVVAITGAGGSIGSQLARQVVEAKPKTVVLIDHSEHHLFEVSSELSRLGFGNHVAILCDIRTNSMVAPFQKYKPDIVLHAAALKHVVMLEDEHNTFEAIQTNVFGTRRVINMAVNANPQVKILCVSTDKAVNPVSHMGLTKRISELSMVERAQVHQKASIGIVRFGNVYGSSGSAVPIFERQIEKGGPVTITDKKMTRYMMTLQEAVGLVLHSVKMLTPGKLSMNILDMSKVKIVDLAEMLIRMSGKRIALKEIGIRPGEKLHEELFYPEEKERASWVEPGIWRIDGVAPKEGIVGLLQELETATQLRDTEETSRVCSKIVPEFYGEFGL